MNAAFTFEKLYASLLIGVCLGAAGVSLRIAAADYYYKLDTPESVKRALELEPQNSQYQERWAAFEPVAAVPALRRAVTLNPYLTSARIELGLRADFAGHRDEAENLLLDAFAHDRMSLTRWTLANFYFRYGAGPKFWEWARASVEYLGPDVTPLFDLSWRTGASASFILDNTGLTKPLLLSRYLNYLIETRRLDAADEVFRRLVSFHEASDSKLLMSLIDKHIAEGEYAVAARLWNATADAGLVQFARLDPKTGASLTNGDFHSAPTSLGFDWHPIWNPDALLLRNRVEFSGRQLDQLQVVWQPLVLVPGGEYKLRCRYTTHGIVPDSGLRWRLLDKSGVRELSSSPSLANEGGMESVWKFQAPADGLARLSLGYQREPGTVRITGTLEIENVSLELLNSSHD
jgi:tetratricopeptide (TPR) repeat protein